MKEEKRLIISLLNRYIPINSLEEFKHIMRLLDKKGIRWANGQKATDTACYNKDIIGITLRNNSCSRRYVDKYILRFYTRLNDDIKELTETSIRELEYILSNNNYDEENEIL